MPNNANQRQSKKKQHHFPVRRPDDPYSVDLVPLTEEQYQEISRIINRKRKQEQRAGRCFSPKKLLWKCSADCDVCPFHGGSGHLSLDYEINNDNGSRLTLIDTLTDEFDISAELEKKELEEAIRLVLQSLAPQDQTIIELFMEGLSERAIADQVKCSQKTVNNRKAAIFSALLKKLEGWL